MPVISMFYGVLVIMYPFDKGKHNLPHIHVRYQEHEAIYAIPQGELIDGYLPRHKSKLVEAWIELHRDELVANWELAINGEAVFKISPLK